MKNSGKPLVSVIVPVYNVEKYIARCVDSLLIQTLSDMEIILVDDGSTDGSSAICDAYAERNPNVVVIHKSNGGLGSARNAGIQVAKGDYIGFVDSDDYVSERMYETLLDLAADHDADCAYCDYIRFWDGKIDNPRAGKQENEVIFYSDDEILNPYLLDRIGCKPSEKNDCSYGATVCCGLFKKKVINDHEITFVSERELISEDMIFDIDYIPCCKRIVHTSDALYFYRFNPDSLTTHYVPDRFEKNVTLCHAMESRLARVYASDVYEESLNRYFLKITRVSLMEEVAHIKQNGWSTAKDNIRRIAENEELEEVMDSYPIKLMPLTQKIFFFALKHKMYLLIAILIKMNTMTKGLNRRIVTANIKVKRKDLLSYIALTFAFMSTCSLFQGQVRSLQWAFFYYGGPLVLFALSLYFIITNRNIKLVRRRIFFITLFCAPRIIMLLYSCIVWCFSHTAFPYISRGISNTMFQCVAYFCGVCIACGERNNILKVTLASASTVFGLAYLIGFIQNGVPFLAGLNPLSEAASNFTRYTELHEMAFTVGLYILVNLVTGKHASLKKNKYLFGLSVFFFIVAWKRIGIFAVILSLLLYVVSSRCKKRHKSLLIKVTGIVGTVMCIAYIALIVSGAFVALLQSVGINLMGRDIIYRYFSQFASFSPFFWGKGVGFVSRQFNYTTSADLFYMASIKALHNDLLKMYIEIGFMGYLIWVFWWLMKTPEILQKKFGVNKALICLMFIVYSFILYTTDNTESYVNFQMHLAMLITYIAGFYTDRRKVRMKVEK